MMSDNPTDTAEGKRPASSLAARLGVPSPRGRRSILFAIVLDTLGVALVAPITLYYFTVVTDQSVARLGVMLSVAMFVALPAGLLGGELVDRFGAKKMMVANNLCSAIGYVGYYLASSDVVIFGGMLLVAISECVFWACWLPYLKGLAARDGFDVWFAFIEAAKSGCMVVGAGLTALLLSVSGDQSLRWLILLNIATCMISSALIGRHSTDGTVENNTVEHSRVRWTTVLRDRRYTLMTAGQLLSTPIGLLGGLAFPLFFVRSWRLSEAAGPAMFTLSNLLTMVLQPPLTRLIRPVRRGLLLWWSSGLCVAAMAMLVVASLGGVPPAWVGWTAATLCTVTLTVAGILFFPTTNSALVSLTTEDNAGKVSAMFHFGTSVSAAVTPAIVGILLTVPNYLWAVMALLNVIGIACFVSALRPQSVVSR